MDRSDLRGPGPQRAVIFVLMAVFLYLGTGIAYNLLAITLTSQRPAPAATPAGRPAAAAPVREPAESYRIVTERNLFKTTTQSIADKQGGAFSQDISLLIDLRGTVAGEGDQGFAIIEEKANRKQRLVKVGALVAGAKVLRIKRNGLDLLVDGQERTLKMAETREAPLLPAVPVAAAGGTIIVNRSDITTGLQDMGSMLRQAQVRPFFNAGVQEGFMVTGIQPGSLYQRLGIQEGDVLQGIDSRNIRTAEDMVTLYNTLKSAPAMTLSVRRSGQQESLNYQFR